MKRNIENARLAKQYNVTDRCVRGWKQSGMPTGNPEAQREWLASRQRMPKVADVLPDAVDIDAAAIVAPTLTGAAAVLKRLEESEAAAHRRLQAAYASNDALQIRNCRENWLKLTEAVRRYDAAVIAQRRIQGETVKRADVEQALETIGQWWFNLCISQANQLPTLVQGACVTEARGVIRRAMLDGMQTTMAASAAHVPDFPRWIIASLTKQLSNSVDAVPQTIDQRTRCLLETVEQTITLGNSLERQPVEDPCI